MRLYDELFKNADGMGGVRCVIVPLGGGYFEGVKAVGEFAEDKVSLCFPSVTVDVTGEGLSIKKYCDGDLELSGKIFCVTVREPLNGRA